MVIVYPMLVSKTVSPAVLPGICKALERYVIIYKMDDAAKFAKSRVQVKRGKELWLKEARSKSGEELDTPLPGESPEDFRKRKAREDSYDERLRRQEEEEREKRDALDDDELKRERDLEDDIRSREKDARDNQKSDREREKAQREKERHEAERAQVDFQLPGNTELAVEPSWVKVRTSVGDRFIGIKVVPIPVKSDYTLAELLVTDKQLHKILKYIVAYSRTLQNAIFRVLCATIGRIPIIGSLLGLTVGTAKGDPKWDVIFARTKFKDNIFVCVNKMDLESDFFESAGGVNSLFKLGWSSIIATDDVNKIATFCMKPFRGLCSVVPYTFLFSSLGHSKVYNDLADVKASSGPLFRMRGRGQKLLDCKLNKVESDNIMLNENLESVKKLLNKAILTKMMGSIKATAKTNDPSKLEWVTKMVKRPSEGDLDKTGEKASPSFKKIKMLTSKVLENSVSIPSEFINPVASFIAFAAIVKSKDNPDKEAKDIMMKFVKQYRQKNLGPEQKRDIAIFIIFFVGVMFPAVAASVAVANLFGAPMVGAVLATVVLIFLLIDVFGSDED